MITRLTYNIIVFLTIFTSVSVTGQNKISVKKSYPTFDAIYQSTVKNGKLYQYYCFKKSSYVYFFSSALNTKKIIKNCSNKDWVKSNASQGKYIYYNDSITIIPVIYSPIGNEVTSDYFYIAVIDSLKMNVSSVGNSNKTTFNLLFPKPITQKK